MRRTARITAVLLAGTLALAGCAGRSDTAGTPTTDPPSGPVVTTTATSTVTSGTAGPDAVPTVSPDDDPGDTEVPDVPGVAVADSLEDLDGRAFELVGLFTDAGGVDTMFEDAHFVIAFDGAQATASTHCGSLRYPELTEVEPMFSDLAIDFGQPEGEDCTFGEDPPFPPQGPLSWGYDADTGRYWLSGGFVAWYFVEVFPIESDECLTGACPEPGSGPTGEVPAPQSSETGTTP